MESAAYYRVHIHTKTASSSSAVSQGFFDNAATRGTHSGRILSYWCFNPGVTMSDLASLKVRSLLLTSGTLSPLDSFAHELKLPFPIRLENPHVISAKQVWVGVLKKGPAAVTLNSSFKFRDDVNYLVCRH
jgi:regulator of telomere elongation helicase 1